MNLFMLSAPYQIHSALEAIHHFRFDDNHLKIVDTGHFSRAQFDAVIDLRMWASIEYCDFRYRDVGVDFGERRPVSLRERLLEAYLVLDRFLKRRRADRIAANIGPLEALVLGNYRRDYDQHMRHLACHLKYKELYVLDVGTDTLKISREREADREGSPFPVWQPCGVFAKLKRSVKRAFLDWDVRGVPALTFFTAYDFDPAGADRVVRNDFAHSREMLNRAVNNDKVLFVGQPLVDQSYVSMETFKSVFQYVREYFSGQTLIYVAHPRESERQLKVVTDAGVDVQRFLVPFEFAIAFGGERPKCIASFFSSALENCATIFGSSVSVRAFRLPEAVLFKERAEVAAVYRHFEECVSLSVDVVDMSPERIRRHICPPRACNLGN